MNFPTLSPLLVFYGLFLWTCGIVSVIFIGPKAKTALISGGMSGALVLLTAWQISEGNQFARWVGIALSLILFVVFSWRSSKTLSAIFELIPERSPDLKGKGVAFLIISLMAVVSLLVFVLQIA
jgi:Transmembrane proteins 14C